MCVVCGETDFTDHKPCPLPVEAEMVAIQAEKNRTEADNVNKNHEIEHKKIMQ